MAQQGLVFRNLSLRQSLQPNGKEEEDFMTRAEAREELKNYRENLKKRQRLHNRVEELRCAMESCRVPTYAEPKRSDPYKLEGLIDKLTIAEEAYTQVLWEQLDFLQKVEGKINKLTGFPYEVIYLRYVEGKRQIDVAFKLDFSIIWVQRNEYKGLDEYASLTEDIK
jgi:DNA-directed RNA polymerase specialized sigma subunit